MGVVRKVATPVLLVLIAYFMGLLPWLTGPEEHIQPYKIAPALNLPESSKVILNGGQKFGEDVLIGAESLPIRQGVLYTGLHTGSIVRIKDGKITNVTLTCGKDEPCRPRRPLGMRFDEDGLLYVADIIAGIYSVDVDTGNLKTLVDPSSKVDGLPILFVDDLDVASDGSIYFSDLSTVSTIDNFWKEMMGNPSGRLIKYNPKTKLFTVLLKNVHGANGVQLSPQEDFVLVNECITGRVLRYYLKGPKKGQSDVFAEGLPGMVDNIRRNGENGIRVFIFGSGGSLEFFNNNQFLRKIFYRFCAFLEQVKNGLPVVFPEAIASTLHSVIPSVEMLLMKPSPVLAVDLDWSGKVTKSYHCTDGSVQFVSELAFLNGDVYAGSPFLPYMMRVQKKTDTKS